MKLLSLLLPLLATVLWPVTLPAQSLVSSAQAVRDTLRDLSDAVDRRVDKNEGRNDIQKDIDKTRDDLRDLQALAQRYAGRQEVAERMVKTRDHFNAAIRGADSRRSETLGRLTFEARRQFVTLEAAWQSYYPEPARGGVYLPGPGYGYPAPVPRGPSSGERAQNLASRELANNLRVPEDTVTITRMEHDGPRYRAYGVVRGAGRYVVDLDAISGRIYSVSPLR